MLQCLLCALLLTAVARLPSAIDTFAPAVTAPNYQLLIHAEEDADKENDLSSPNQV